MAKVVVEVKLFACKKWIVWREGFCFKDGIHECRIHEFLCIKNVGIKKSQKDEVGKDECENGFTSVYLYLLSVDGVEGEGKQYCHSCIKGNFEGDCEAEDKGSC